MTFPFPFLSTARLLAPVEIFNRTLSANLSVTKRTVRTVFNSALIPAPATRIRVKVIGNGLDILNMFVGRQASSGSAWFMDGVDTTPARITFGGNNSITTPTVAEWSDWVDFPIDPSKNLIISLDMAAGNCRYNSGAITNVTPYHKVTNTEEAGALAPTGYSGGNLIYITAIEISP